MAAPHRTVGLDVGDRRIGVAISDVTATLARPLATIRIARGDAAAPVVSAALQRLAAEEDGLAEIVVGLPLALDGRATGQTARVRAFADELGRLTGRPIVFQDERLTSREAESRLAREERDWRKRKARLDAAAAAVILQDYLDARGRDEGRGMRDEERGTRNEE